MWIEHQSALFSSARLEERFKKKNNIMLHLERDEKINLVLSNLNEMYWYVFISYNWRGDRNKEGIMNIFHH